MSNRSNRDQSAGSPSADPSKDSPNSSAAGPAKPKRTRGPNKPKPPPPPSLISMRTEAQISQTAIIELLSRHVSDEKSSEIAASMVLQVWNDATGCWADVQAGPENPEMVRFATKGYTNS